MYIVNVSWSKDPGSTYSAGKLSRHFCFRRGRSEGCITLKTPIQYKTFVFEKRAGEEPFALEGRMAKEISLFFRTKGRGLTADVLGCIFVHVEH